MAKGDVDWFAIGRKHQWSGRPIDAMLCFRRAIAERPRLADARFHLGEVQWMLGLVDGAKASWTEAMRHSPRHLASRLALAEASLNSGDAAGAKAAAEGALALAPNDARAKTFLLIANATLGEPDVDWSAIADAVRGKPAMLGAPARAELLAAQAKLYASNAAWQAADHAVQVYGGRGWSTLYRVGRHLTDVRVCRIYEGTDEILKLKVAAAVLGKEYEAFK